MILLLTQNYALETTKSVEEAFPSKQLPSVSGSQNIKHTIGVRLIQQGQNPACQEFL